MTRSGDADLGPAPLDVPLSYPGPPADRPFRLTGDSLARLPVEQAGELARRRAAEGGTPVLAVGSNACPAQLAAKFAAARHVGDVVGLPVRVTGVQTGLSAHLGRSGYWPFAPVHRDGSAGRAVVCVLDDVHLAVLDRTEPNYRRNRLAPDAHQLVHAPDLGVLEVYVSVHGVIDDARLPSWSDAPPPQEVLLDALLGLLPPDAAGDVPMPDGPSAPSRAADLSRALRTVEGFAAHATALLKRHVDVSDAGLAVAGPAGTSS